MVLGGRSLALLPDTIPETEPWPALAEALQERPDDSTSMERRWLTIAVSHRSYLSERAADLVGVGQGCLMILDGVGTSVLNLELHAAVAASAPLATVPDRHDEVVRLGRPLRRAIVDRLDLMQWARLGRGEARSAADRIKTGDNVRTFTDVGRQLIGWWALVKSSRQLHEWLTAMYRTALSTAAPDFSNWSAVISENFSKLQPQFSLIATGPGHSPTFVANLRTNDGRTGSGEGKSKKEARQVAARDYLQRHAPQLLEGRKTSAQPARSRPPVVAARDQHRLGRIPASFGCADTGPFLQALTHRSWVFENRRGADIERESNAALALLGSAVLGACVARARAQGLLSATADPDPELAGVRTLADRDLVPLFERLGLGAAFRLGAGQRASGVSIEMAANAVQAVLAASYLQHESLSAFEDDLSDAVRQFLRAHAQSVHHDPTTRLQELALELGMRVKDTYTSTAPDHDKTHRATLTVTSSAGTIRVSGSGSSKRNARRSAASVVVAAAESLVASSPGTGRHDLAGMLLRRQLAVLPSSKRRWPEWRRNGRLGASLLRLGDWNRYDAWARTTVKLLGQRHEPTEDLIRALQAFYAPLIRGPEGRPVFASALASVRAWIHEAAQHDVTMLLDDGPWQRLVGLSAAQAVWLASDEPADTDATMEHWVLMNGRRLRIGLERHGSPCRTSARTAAALLRCLHEAAGQQRSASDNELPEVTVSMTGDEAAKHLKLTASAPWRDDVAELPLIQLVCEAAPGLTVRTADVCTLAITVLPTPADGNLNWLSATARSNGGTDDYDGELGRILHDLKNEITAARVALASEAPSRTERLAAQLDASRHLDAAEALVARTADVDVLYSGVDLQGVTDVARFMRGYLSDLLRALPRNLRLVPPADADVVVAIGERPLRSILDNLVKNAIEAMPVGGELRVDYAAEDTAGMALLEVVDTGPGIPYDVVEALGQGRPVTSGKHEGSGLGLAGVQRLLHRVGGSLEPIARTNGRGWLVTIPLAAGDQEVVHEDVSSP